MDRISFQDFRFNTMSMLNLLQEACDSNPEGITRDAAYNEVGKALDLGDNAFTMIS